MYTHERGLTLHRQTPEYWAIRIPRPHHHSIQDDNAAPVQRCISSPPSPSVNVFPFFSTSRLRRAAYVVDRSATLHSLSRAQGENAPLHCLVTGNNGSHPSGYGWESSRCGKAVDYAFVRADYGNTSRSFHKGVLARFGDREGKTKGITIPGPR